MHTKDKLAEALRRVNLQDMAKLAEGGYYHDFLSPLDLPELTLVAELGVAAQAACPSCRTQILELRSRVMDGDFDANKEESEAWANSPEGQEAFSRLTRGK